MTKISVRRVGSWDSGQINGKKVTIYSWYLPVQPPLTASKYICILIYFIHNPASNVGDCVINNMYLSRRNIMQTVRLNKFLNITEMYLRVTHVKISNQWESLESAPASLDIYLTYMRTRLFDMRHVHMHCRWAHTWNQNADTKSLTVMDNGPINAYFNSFFYNFNKNLK